MSPDMIVLRIMHIFSAVALVGGGILMFGFVEPAVRATAPAGQKFMQYLMVRRHYSQFMGIVSVLAVIAGALLYWKDSSGLQLTWITTPTGVGLSLGAAIGISAAIFGYAVIRPTADRLGAQVEAAGRPPTPDQIAELGALSGSMTRLGKIDFVLLSLALLYMATTRYW